MAGSALVVLVPEADDLVRPFRDRYDPSSAAGMPAHITLVHPFKPLAEMDEIALGNLRQCFAHALPIRFALRSIRRFPTEVLYLAPEPDAPFRQLISAVRALFPETPPYGGKWLDIVPHLTVAWLSDERALDRATDDFIEAARGRLPIQAIASEVALMVDDSRHWQVHATFSLGPKQ